MNIKFSIARIAELEKLVDLNARAFEDYPLYAVMKSKFKTKKDYKAFLNTFMTIFIKQYINLNLCFKIEVNQEIAGFIVLNNPNIKESNAFSYIKSGGLSILKHISAWDILSFIRFIAKTTENLDKEYPKRFHIVNIAVDKDYRGRGLGQKLIKEAIEEVKKQGGELLSLTTNTVKNKIYYEKLGLKLIKSERLCYNEIEIDNFSFIFQSRLL